MVEGSDRAVETAEAVVIGGGVVGCAVLFELAQRSVEATLVEAEPDVAEGASKANSAIIHTGFDARTGTIESQLLRRAADRWPSLLHELRVPSLTCGALMIARTSDEVDRLDGIARLAAENGVEVEIVDARWLRDAAPYVTAAATAALHVPAETIVDPFWLTRAYAEVAIELGAAVWLRARVGGLSVDSDGVDVTLTDGRRLRARQVFDCAGLWADDVARLAGDTTFALRPRKGQFLVSERTYGADRIVLPIPGPLGKGMLVTPIVFGGVMLGPTAEDGEDKADRSTTLDARRRILESCAGLVPDVEQMEPIRSFAGVRAVSSTGDFIIRPSSAGDRLTIVAGIRSTGISASPAIAETAVDLAAVARGWRPLVPRPTARAAPPELTSEAGAVVCVCRSVAAAEVEAALADRPPPATTDAVKRRCGAGFGDCQGNRCLALVLDRIAARQGTAVGAIEKGPVGSWLVIDGRSPGTAAGPIERPEAGAVRMTGPGPDGDRAAVVVVGGGLAGIGAALAATEAGLEVIVVDRGPSPGGALAALGASWWTDPERTAVTAIAERTAGDGVRWWGDATVVGLDQGPDGWLVDVARAAGAATIAATDVVLASGGYVTPREQLAIDGPRPSGVMTADFAADALDRGWRPARRAVVTGSGRLARGLIERLIEAGVDVVGAAETADGTSRANGAEPPVTAIRGERRLEAVRLGDEWVEADGLVIAHALRPASFLLRGLGIGDDRPGVPMPAAASGALPLRGLWAAGSCVEPAIDHDGSLEAGAAVGRALVARATGQASVGAGS